MLKRLVTLTLLLAACKEPQVHVEAPREERYRPSWTTDIALHKDAIARCLEGRETPAYVLHIEPLSTGAEGVSTVDAYGAVENCACDSGRVIRRQTMREAASEYRGLPVFAPGIAQPVVPVGVLVEEVFDGSVTLGWLFWPPSAPVEGSAVASPGSVP